MFARLHILLLKIDKLERVSKYPRIVFVPRCVGYWGYIYYICILYNTCTVEKKENAVITLSAMEIHY